MAIGHLLLDTATIYDPTITVDAYGGDDTIWTTIAQFMCRIEEIGRGRKQQLGRDNTNSTHRIYCVPEVLPYLNLKSVIGINNEQYEIVNFEDLDPIIDNSQILHIEIYVKWQEQIVLTVPTPVGIGVMIIESTFIVG